MHEPGRHIGKTKEYSNQVLRAIASYSAIHGYSPSIRELVKMTDLSSTSTVNYHLRKLTNEGMLYRRPYLARAYSLSDKALAALSGGAYYG